MKKKLVFLLMLVFLFGCADKQVIKQRPELSAQQKMLRRKVIEQFVLEFGKRRQRKECLSYEVATAAQAQRCFDCHDLWKKWEQEQLKK